MREISAATITKAIRDMCIEANYGLAPDMRKVFEKAVEEEESPLGRRFWNSLRRILELRERTAYLFVRIQVWLWYS